MRWSTLREKLPKAAEEFGKADLWLYATSGTYYLFFSLGPLAAVVLGLLPWLPFTEQQLADALLAYAPGPFRDMIAALVSDVYAGSALALGVGIVAELWSAGKFAGLLIRGVGQIYDGQPYGGYLRRRLMGMVYTAVLIALVLGNLTLVLFSERLLAAAGLSENAKLWTVLLRMRGLLFFTVVTLINALIYRTVPHRELSFCRQLPGAAFAAAVWLAFSQIFSWAVDRFRFYSIYGGLAIVFVSLFWIYCSLYLLFLGAWLNALRDKI